MTVRLMLSITIKILFKDKFNNEFITEKFFYDISKNLLKLENAKLKDTR